MTATGRNHTRLIAVGTAVVVCLLIYTLVLRPAPEQRAAEMLRQARLLAAQGELLEAENLARDAATLNGRLSMAHRLAAECAFARKDFDLALNDLSQINASEHDDWLIGRQLAADILHNHVFRFRDAEEAYQKVLAIEPDNIFANDGYARLLGLCGRRAEAIPHVVRLIRAGEETDLLILLSRESGSLNNPEMLEAARKADPTDPNPLIGQATVAASAQKPALALKLLRQAESMNGLPSDFHGRLGRQLFDTQQFEELLKWSQSFSPGSASSDAWIVLAELAERSGDQRGSIRCFWESLKLVPESLKATNQLARQLTADGQKELATPFLRRVKQLNEFRDRQQLVIMSDEEPAFEDMVRMVAAYESVGRLWEALAWAQLTLRVAPGNSELRELLQSIKVRVGQLPETLTAPNGNPALQIDLSHYPLPEFNATVSPTRTAETSRDIVFTQQDSEIGFNFTYFDGTDTTTRRMFEFSGGGIAVLDFDNDHAPDLFCTQGHPWELPDSQSSPYPDALFRNHQGERFEEVPGSVSGMIDRGFGQGVSAGDINNDGFVDLYVATTGINILWINNGDGTFLDASASLADRTSQWTTSCLIADINGDSAPDLYDVNYLSGDDVFDRVCTDENGQTVMCAPYDFEPARDRLWLSDGMAGYTEKGRDYLKPPPDGKGLGIAAVNVRHNRLSLFVANDTTANFFYTAEAADSASLTDTAGTVGLAFNGDGKAEACMGIAVGDCTQDGRLDFAVTNFLYESNTLYSSVDGHLYEDRTRELGLHDATLPVLGFGTQFLDANLDGSLELFVTNGFTQDLSEQNTPYQMKPQLFEWTGEGFLELPEQQLGPWSRTRSVGRAAARLDWNLDGRPDLVVGRLDAPYFVLTNQSAESNCRFLRLTLVATSTARDAIGTTVAAAVGDSTQTHQLTAGDGYQCSNERQILIGGGSADQIDHLSITWPSGRQQTFDNISIPQSAILIEGSDRLISR